ncbi:MAG: type 1 glutamine amidotransferase [Verrucomicrobium sp.]|nr:type 1 glutamine amidotransferase [Verrucomicrobium sp.]
MPFHVATWMRPKDEDLFARSFAPFPEIVLRDQRHPLSLDEADGLLLTGGCDISQPFLRQDVPDPAHIQEPEPDRDAWEFPALRRALERGIPVLGICRGHQVLNVGLGGTLLLDIPGHGLPEQRDGNIQDLRYEAERPFCRFEKVNSSHHQAIDRLGEGLAVEARSADGVIEQVRHRKASFVAGVQYHPERHPQYGPLFAAFAEAVKNQA